MLYVQTDTIIPGDANCDGVVDVLDVVTIVDFYLDLNPQPFCYENADVNQDGIIDILDIVGTVNIFTQGKLFPYPDMASDKANIYLTPNGIKLFSDGTLTGLEFELTGNVSEDFAINLDLPDHDLVKLYKDGKLSVLIYSLNNTPVPEGMVSIASFNNDGETLTWGKVIAANINAESVPVDKHVGTTSIDEMSPEDIIDFKAFPNPANDVLRVSFINQSNEPVSISLLNIHGQVTEQKTVYEQGRTELSFNLENLQSGLYLLRMNYDNALIMKKIMVNK